MPTPLIVSNRGQVTLPAAMRKRLGIKGGDVVIVEDRGTEIVLKPAVVLEIQQYSDDDIGQWALKTGLMIGNEGEYSML